jgi:hypothetical protein
MLLAKFVFWKPADVLASELVIIGDLKGALSERRRPRLKTAGVTMIGVDEYSCIVVESDLPGGLSLDFAFDFFDFSLRLRSVKSPLFQFRICPGGLLALCLPFRLIGGALNPSSSNAVSFFPKLATRCVATS